MLSVIKTQTEIISWLWGEKSEDTKGAIRSLESKFKRYNGQQKRDNGSTKHYMHPLTTGGESRCSNSSLLV